MFRTQTQTQTQLQLRGTVRKCRARGRCLLILVGAFLVGVFLIGAGGPTSASAQAVGSLGANPNPCEIPPGQTFCNPLIVWQSSGLSDPFVAITVSASWGTQTFHCAPSNQAGSKQTVGVRIGVIPKTFRLYEVSNCSVDPQTAGTLLAEAEVRAHPTGSVVCSEDNRVLQATDPGYLGLIGNAVFPAIPNRPFIAAEVADAGVRHWRRTVQWLQLEPDPPSSGSHVYDWPRFDTLFLPIVAEGVAPWLTLSHTAPWAADLPPGVDPSQAHKYPPRDIQDWRDFVRAVATRYGPGGILAVPVRNWDIWQEPDITRFFLGTPDDYVELLNAAYDEIKTLDPGAMVWAGNVVFYPNRPASEVTPWINATLANGLFDGFAIHPFHREVKDYYRWIAGLRAKIDQQLGPGVPLAVTATSYDPTAGDCAFANLTAEQRAAFVLDTYACGANAGASHVMWFKTIDRPPTMGGTCPLDATGVLTPSDEDPFWEPNSHLESLRRVADALNAGAAP